MKKNISINLFGTLYQIDEDAYSLLERYIDSMKSYFSRQEGGEEIADDIEHRVAELLWQQKQGGAEAVNIDDIKNIIKTIGNPADFEEEAGADGAEYAQEVKDENNGEENNTYGSNYKKESSQYSSSMFDQFKQRVAGRRLYRDPYNKVLGGVCSGLSTYFNYGDPVMWRLAFVLLCFLLPFLSNIFSGITGLFGFTIHIFSFPTLFMTPLLYLVLLVVVPEARTPEDRLRMQGKEVTPENIQEEVLNEASGMFGGSSYSSCSSKYSSSFKSTGAKKTGVDGVYGNSTADSEATHTEEGSYDKSERTEGEASENNEQSEADREEKARRAKASYDQYMYYKKSQSSTGATIAKGCGIGCLAIIFAPVLFALVILLFVIVCLAFAAMCVPFGIWRGEIDYEPFTIDSYGYGNYHNIPFDVFVSDHPWGVFIGSLAVLIVVFISVYAIVRRFKSDRKRFSSSTRSAFIIMWIVAAAIATVTFGSLSYKYSSENERLSEKCWNEFNEKQEKEWTINGVKFHNGEDYNFFINNGWKMTEVNHCADRFTFSGEYMDDEGDVRYLDSYADGGAMRYTAENSETLQPGTYRLVANCRAKRNGAYIFCYIKSYGKKETMKYAEIPSYGNHGGNIWMAVADFTSVTDSVVRNLVGEIKDKPMGWNDDDDRMERLGDVILRSNDGKGYGWSYVYIDNIVVKEPVNVSYGVTTVKDGKSDYHGWFSATDFRFVKVN